MSSVTRYHPGGFVAAALMKNQAETWDGTAATYTAWDVNGAVTTTRALTAPEVSGLAAQDTANTAATNAAIIRTQAQNALANNTTYLAIGTPTNAQVVAQVQALTRQSNGVIRLLISQLDATT